jgi:thymidylate synthase ThyX
MFTKRRLAAGLLTPARGSEPSRASHRFIQVRFCPLNGLIARDNHLRDPVAFFNPVRLAAQIQQDDFDLAPIAGIDSGGRVWQRDRMLQREPASRSNLRFIAGGQFDRQSGRNQLRNACFQHYGGDGAEIHSGILERSVCIGGQICFRYELFDLDLHAGDTIIASPMNQPRRVLTVAPMPPEKAAYALARYSRSPDSIRESVEWVRSHDSQKFLDSFYFAYGHASIADLGHLTICFEGVSELAATEIEDEQLWDGQARSSRYQNFGTSGFVIPPEFTGKQTEAYQAAGTRLLQAYTDIHAGMTEYFRENLPRPADMKPDAYERNVAARAFDVARYCLFFGIPTGVGQVVSIRTLEKQIRRLKASPYTELVSIADELGRACSEPPACTWSDNDGEPVAPTLAKHVDTDSHRLSASEDLREWVRQNLQGFDSIEPGDLPDSGVDLLKPADTLTDIAATLLYPVTRWSYRRLYETAAGWSSERRREIVDVALRSRTRRDELLREFRSSTYAYDIVMDIGAYRDLHRHRRCYQFRQEYGAQLGFAKPQILTEAGLERRYEECMAEVLSTLTSLPGPGSHYLLPFATNSRFLFKMDFAEAEYISRLRSGVKGHFSYREIAWKMKQKMSEMEPDLGILIDATPPSVEDPLKR